MRSGVGSALRGGMPTVTFGSLNCYGVMGVIGAPEVIGGTPAVVAT